MSELVSFFTNYGLVSTGIAILGIIILGLLKYFKLFSKFDVTTRHYIYLSISIGLTLVGTLIYQILLGIFEGSEFFAMSSTVYTLNQTFYNLFKVTPVNKLGTKLLTNTLGLFGVKPEDFDDSEDCIENNIIDDENIINNDEDER